MITISLANDRYKQLCRRTVSVATYWLWCRWEGPRALCCQLVSLWSILESPLSKVYYMVRHKRTHTHMLAHTHTHTHTPTHTLPKVDVGLRLLVHVALCTDLSMHVHVQAVSPTLFPGFKRAPPIHPFLANQCLRKFLASFWLVKTSAPSRLGSLWGMCSGLEFMVIKPHPVAMIQTPSGV